MSVTVKRLPLGELGTNCLLILGENGEAAVVDPAEYNDDLQYFLEENGVFSLDYILLTHGHFDHISGVLPLQSVYGGKIVIHEKDEICFKDATYSLLSSFRRDISLPEKADITVAEGSVLPFGKDEIKVIHTPGHTQGSVCYIINRNLISGDTLFYMSMGRTDFPGGNIMRMIASLRKLCRLEGEYAVFPGHGELTTLEYERNNNPYCVAGKSK